MLDANSAGTYGGGIMIYQTYVPSTMVIDQSTLSRNTAQYGGGIYYNDFVAARSKMTLRNSTLGGNTASHDGGGIYAIGDAHISGFNATIASNVVFRPFGQFWPARRGGVFITNGVQLPQASDCFGPLRSLGYNLIETTSNCSISGTTVGNVTGQDPRLGPLGNNGGSTQTQALLTGSSAIDAGNVSGCTDNLGAAIAIDRRGFHRPVNGGVNGVRCDIGAYEYYPVSLFLPLIKK